MKPVSSKRQKQLREYTKLRKRYLSDHPTCERCRTKQATQIHHKAKRNGPLLTEVKYFMATCFPCHEWIENNKREAEKHGWIIRIYRPMNETIILLTKKEADDLRAKINEELEAGFNRFDQAAIFLNEYRDRDGWRAHGYKSFTEFFEKELESKYGSRSTMYRLLKQTEVQKNVNDGWKKSGVEPPTVTKAAAAVLDELPPEEQAEALEDAIEEYGPTPTTKQIKDAVHSRKPSPATDEVKSELKVISKAIGRTGDEFVRAIESGVIAISIKDIRDMAALEPSTIHAAADLISDQRWTFARTMAFLNRMLSESDTIQELIWQAKASGGKWEGTIKGYRITVKEA